MAKYRLLCGKTTNETVREAQEHRFSVVSAERVLIYTDKRVKCGGIVPATDETVARVSDIERTWLRDSVTETCIGRVDVQQAAQNDKAFMEAFERELKTEQERLSGREASENGKNE